MKMVHFRGGGEVVAARVPDEGAIVLELPPGGDPSDVADAVEFVLGTRDGADVVQGEHGFAFVELGLRTADDEDASLFRGVDHRGGVQVSLREEGGLRVTGGVEAVAERLTELLDGDVARWVRGAVVGDRDESTASTASAEEPSKEAPDGPSPLDESAHAEAVEAVAVLRRSVRVARLGALAEAKQVALLEHGARLRRERAEIDRVVDRENAERDRVRTRLRRVNEFRDQVARVQAQEAAGLPSVEPPQSRAGALVEWGIAGCAALLLATLVLYVTAATGDEHRPMISIGLGLAFLVSVSSYLLVAGRTVARPVDAERAHDGGETAGTATSQREWREALRHRFADLSDPDDPNLPRRLRERLSALDARLGPLHARLERLDELITVFDVEAGRSARALHVALPESGLAEDGLPEGMDDQQATRLVHELGDAVYATTVERDALLVDGTTDVASARAHVEAILRRVLAQDASALDTCLEILAEARVEPTAEPVEDALAEALLEAVVSAVESEAPERPVEREPEDVLDTSASAIEPDAGEPPDLPPSSRFVILRSAVERDDVDARVEALRESDPSIRQVVVAVMGDATSEPETDAD